MSVEILVLYYSRGGSTAELARQACRGIESVAQATAKLRTVPPVSAESERPTKPVPDSGAPYATLDDLQQADGVLLGSPTRFGNMAAPLKYFLDGTSALWLAGALAGKPAGVFSASQSMHGGQESTLLTMMLPLIHHGMYIVGVPFTHPDLSTTRSGGSPYGATHVGVAAQQPGQLADAEKRIAQSLGARVAELAVTLAAARRARPG